MNQSSIINLNIGGILYTTTRSTLLKYSPNFFSGLLDAGFSIVKDANGSIFIDRDGEYFKPILEFLRTGKWNVDATKLDPIRALEELDFYGLQSPTCDMSLLKLVQDHKRRQEAQGNFPLFAELIMKKFHEQAEVQGNVFGLFVVPGRETLERRISGNQTNKWESLLKQYPAISLQPSSWIFDDELYEKLSSERLNWARLEAYLAENHQISIKIKVEERMFLSLKYLTDKICIAWKSPQLGSP